MNDNHVNYKLKREKSKADSINNKRLLSPTSRSPASNIDSINENTIDRKNDDKYDKFGIPK
jgi:hypothetical protein